MSTYIEQAKAILELDDLTDFDDEKLLANMALAAAALTVAAATYECYVVANTEIEDIYADSGAFAAELYTSAVADIRSELEGCLEDYLTAGEVARVGK